MATPVKRWRPSAADTIDDDLSALWRELAREAPVSRAVMSNLVVYCRRAAGDDGDPATPPEGVPIDDVARHHPARVILLHHDPDASDQDDESSAHVGALTFGPPDARYGVEQIVIRSRCDEAALPSIVRRLVLGDVPTTVWWTEDLSGSRPLTPLVSMGRQLLYDSRRWRDVRAAVLTLAPLLTDAFKPDLADVNWRRLLPVRQALVHAVRSCDPSKRQRLTSVHIRHRRGEAALAWLLAGWLQSTWGPPFLRKTSGQAGGPIRLKPDPTGGEVSVDEDPDLNDDVLTAAFDDGLHLRLGSQQVSVDDPLGPAPFAVAIPSETEAEAVSAELRVLTHDVALHSTLAVLVERFGSA